MYVCVAMVSMSVTQLVLEPSTKLPYKKLQYPIYMKDTNLDANIKIL
jgi:hypothetical protein